MLGSAIVVMRTRYVVGAYLVIFGFIIVAAYKMGMVHERPQVIARARPIDPSTMGQSPKYESGSVLEIREDEKRSL
jgi:hypothetical protein